MTTPGKPTGRLRPVRTDDLPVVRAMNEAAVPHVNSITLDDFARFQDEAAYFTVAILDGVAAAFLVGLTPGLEYNSPNYRWFCGRFEQFVYIDRIVVHHDLRRSGLGRLLYEDLAAFAATVADWLTCEVNVRPANEGSLLFHQRMGFAAVGEQDTEGGEKRVRLMARDLRLTGSSER